MSRARLALLICGVLLVVSAPTAAAKTDVLRLARRALHIAERADKAARAKPKPIASKNIARGGIANANLADGSVDARTLGPGSVTSAALAIGAVGSAALVDGDVSTDDLARIIRDGTITSADIASPGVHTVDLDDLAVTGAKLADQAVIAGKLAAGAVNGAAIADGTVDTDDLRGGAVTAAKLAAGASSPPRCSTAR